MSIKRIILASTALIALSVPAFAIDTPPWGSYSTTYSNYPSGNDARQRSHDEYWERQRLEKRQREHLAQEARVEDERKESMDNKKYKKKHSNNGNPYGQKKHHKKAPHDNGRRGHDDRR
jgi:hypothetical protein